MSTVIWDLIPLWPYPLSPNCHRGRLLGECWVGLSRLSVESARLRVRTPRSQNQATEKSSGEVSRQTLVLQLCSCPFTQQSLIYEQTMFLVVLFSNFLCILFYNNIIGRVLCKQYSNPHLPAACPILSTTVSVFPRQATVLHLVFSGFKFSS